MIGFYRVDFYYINFCVIYLLSFKICYLSVEFQNMLFICRVLKYVIYLSSFKICYLSVEFSSKNLLKIFGLKILKIRKFQCK